MHGIFRMKFNFRSRSAGYILYDEISFVRVLIEFAGTTGQLTKYEMNPVFGSQKGSGRDWKINGNVFI